MSARPRRSWVDGLLSGVERMPGPPWLVCLALGMLLGVLSVVLRWADGTYPFPELAIITTAFAAAGAYLLGVLGYLTRAASRALQEFRPALGDLELRYDEFERRLTTMPQWQALLALGLGLLPPIAGHLTGGWGISDRTSLVTNLYTIGVQVFLNALFVAYLIRAVRQFRVIAEIHRGATEIRLSDPSTHSAFSRFTFRAAVAVTVPFALVEALAGMLDEATIVEIVLFVVALVASVAVFVLPLWGMHRRLAALKAGELARIDRAFDRASGELVGGVQSGARAKSASAAGVVSGLGVARERVRHLSAWPWSPEALRGFVTSIALPIVLWVGTPLLEVFSPG